MAVITKDSRQEKESGCLEAPERNRYFHGKMLDVRHFRLETDYHSGKRQLINRLVLGWGVVCGLGVREACDGEALIVEPGVAIDSCGREIVVDGESQPIAIPPELLAQLDDPKQPPDEEKDDRARPAYGDPDRRGDRLRDVLRDPAGVPGYSDEWPDEPELDDNGGYGRPGDDPDDDSYDDRPDDRPRDDRDDRPRDDGPRRRRWVKAHLVLCYHECSAEPTPVLAGDCRDEEPCQPGLIREGYRLEIRPGCLPIRRPRLVIEDVIDNEGRVDYPALVREVSAPCPCPEDCCIPLANIHLGRHGEEPRCRQKIDLTVRPIVFTNDLLFQLILSSVIDAPSYRSRK